MPTNNYQTRVGEGGMKGAKDTRAILSLFTIVHGGGAWSEDRRRANFHTPKPERPTVFQYFSTVYNPKI